MLTDTPCTEMTGLKKPGRLKIRRAPYDENDSVMRDIQERMKEKRKKKADLSRSRRLNITNASLMLKLSLRANNRALAKALEDAHCEARQDKEMIFELQCALEAAQHELRQCHQMIQDLKLEGQSMIGMLTTLQESEESHRKRVAEVKTLLNEVTAKYLLNTVALIDKAADICNTPSLSKASSIFIRKSSVSEDDSSRDTFSALIPETQGIVRSNIYCRNSKTAKGEEASSEIPSEPVAEDQDDHAGSHVNESIAIDEATIPTFGSQTDCQLKRRSSTSRKRSRTAFFLDPKEMQHALASEVGHQSQICEEKEELSCSVSEFAAHCTDDRPQEAAIDDPEKEMNDKFQEVAADDPENESDKISSVDSVSNTGKSDIGDKDQCALEKTDYREQDMELTSKDEKETHVETSQGDVPVQMESEIEKMQERDLVEENKTAKEPKVGGKKTGRVKKSLKKKHLKKVNVKKAILKAGGEGSQGTSVFDLSESFSQPVSPHQHQKEKRFEQNLSTESEKSEPGEASSSGANKRSDGHVGGSVETRKLEGEKEMNVEDEPPVETWEEEDRPKMCRRSRKSHGAVQLVSSSNKDEVMDGPIRETVLASPHCEELSVPQRTLKPLSQVLNESSCREGADNENSNALSMKAKLNKKTIKPKQKKRLYDPKKSLDKEFTHTVINSSQDLALPYPENATNRNSSKFKRRHRSGTVGKEERVKEISNESLSGLLEESWMKDFLNDIDSEDEGKFTARTAASRKKSQVKTRGTRKTFKMDSNVSNEEESGPLMDSNENSLMNDEPLVTEDHTKKVKDRKVVRRGTVCLKKGSEGSPKDGYSESTSRLSRDCDVDAVSRISDDLNKDRMSDLMAGKGRVKNFASFVMMDEMNKEPVMEKGRNVVRRGTFDIEPQEEEEDSNTGIKGDDKKEQNENKSEKRDKNEGRQKKRKSDIMEKDLEEGDGDIHGKTLRKRQKRDKEEDEEWIEEGDPSEEGEMVKRPSRRGSKRSSSGRSNHRRKTHDVEKVETKELAEISEDEEGVLQVVDDLLESKNGCDDECEEKCSQLKPSKMRDGSLTELAKSDQKLSKISKVPRLKKKIIVEDSSDENASHDDSISSVESVSAKPDKTKKHSGIPRRKEGSKNVQKFYGNIKRRENNSVMNGSCLKMKHLPAEAKLDKEMDAKSQGIISVLEDRKAVTFDEKEKAKEVLTDTLGRKSEESVDKRTLRELKDEAAKDKKEDEERDLAKEEIQEEQSVIKKHVTVDKEQRCDTEDVCEVNESGDASTSVPEETGRMEETGQAETGRRPSRQARAKAAQSLKEPSLVRKLRRGDPFTDNMLLTSPMVKNKKVKKNKKVNQNQKSKPALGDATNVI
ncbi:hypothetical protein HOLleu_34850 [Holothuria leucospilota]|uniref:Shugoshin C-terminal domain-containing protein n=1 Tax=Holothuria leucospilota TaxID=206669 RepID=A0A9Q1BHE6_HOLLE|nr:hypothetical protein HOLleu_34850 [Holothuria leucospilota]